LFKPPAKAGFKAVLTVRFDDYNLSYLPSSGLKVKFIAVGQHGLAMIQTAMVMSLERRSFQRGAARHGE
jgi:hypothetical protein